jgi:diguanylate cyclase (GGDEF)-like protein
VTNRDRDALTQLLGRSVFDSDLEQHAKGASPDMPASLVFADVDHFKKVNDKHGHLVGDAVLKEVARRVIMVADGKGEAYRVGGEEIALILPNHSEGEGLAVAERARQSVEGNRIAGLSLTASFGVAVVPGHANSPTDWLKRADEAMYDAKRYGRNLVRLTGEPAPQQVERRGRLIRKQAEPGALSDEKAQELRMEFFRSGFVLCPTDQFQLEVNDCTNVGSLGKDIYVACPVCGFHAWLRGPQRQ